MSSLFYFQHRVVDNCKVRLQIWDTAGQERFRSMAPMYYRGVSPRFVFYLLLWAIPKNWEGQQGAKQRTICHEIGQRGDSGLRHHIRGLFPRYEHVGAGAAEEYVGRFEYVLAVGSWKATRQNHVTSHCSSNISEKHYVPFQIVIHVVGNKSDLASVRRTVPISRTREYVEQTLGSDCVVHEVSAKDDDGKLEEVLVLDSTSFFFLLLQ